MAELRHAPYSGGGPPMAIGLKALDLAEWIEPDEHLAGELAEKERLLDQRHAEVYAERPDSRPAQEEVLSLLLEHLPRIHPEIYRRDGSRIHIIPTGTSIEVEHPEESPLQCASRLVQEDLVLMQRGDSGWRLAAASLCFPSTWVLAEKFGRDMDGIHKPVPGYAEHLGPRLLRIFDNLQVERPVWRLNWSIYDSPDLFAPRRRPGPRIWLSEGVVADANCFIRVERQTLRKLPATGFILFTIKVLLDPLAALGRHPEGPRLASGLKLQLQQLDTAQLAYKGLVESRDLLVAALARYEAASA
jgi:hypothetical protein